MAITENTHRYSTNVSTNLRIEPEVKKALVEEAEQNEKSMSDIINEILKKRYNKPQK